MAVSFHYFRLARPAWEKLLTRVRQLGTDTIVCPVPWGFHEFADNQFDMQGFSNPRRDLLGFIKLCSAMNFTLVLELSPLAPNANLLNAGLPGWLIHQHPGILQTDATGKIHHRPSLEHPVFIQYLTRWWQTLGETLSPLKAENPHLRFQLSPIETQLDFNEHSAGVQWQIWLRKKYIDGGIDALNADYAPSRPFKSIGQIKLSEKLESPVFQNDKRAFVKFIAEHAHQTYQDLLATAELPLSEAISIPAHAVQINPDPADVGGTFQWAMSAPIHPDGTPDASFWAIKEQNTLKQISSAPAEYQILFTPSHSTAPFDFASVVSPFRLLLNGELLSVDAKVADGKTTFDVIGNDEYGQSDFFFTLPNADTPLIGELSAYLQSLLEAQWRALNRGAMLIRQLNDLLTPKTPIENPPAHAGLSEAQHALTEANAALQRAAKSIGALEEVFATALNKPTSGAPALPFLALDVAELSRIKRLCEKSLGIIDNLNAPALTDSFSVRDYQMSYQNLIAPTLLMVEWFEEQLCWLREELSTSKLAASAWTIHAQVDIILQTLNQGVLRR